MDDLLFGLGVTVVGMGVVFAMLLLLWGLLALLGRLDTVAVVAPGGAAPAPPGAARAPAHGPAADGPVVLVDGADGLEPSLVAAITVAVLRHAEARRLQAAPSMRAYWPGSLLFASRWVSAGRTRQAGSWRRRPR